MFSQAWVLVKKISTSILEVLFSTRGYLIFFCLYIVSSNCLIVFFINNIIINHFDLFILLVFWSQLCMFNSFCSYYLTVCLYLSWPEVLPVLSFLLCICCPIGWANCAVDHGQLVPHALLFSLYDSVRLFANFSHFNMPPMKLYSIRESKLCHECSLTIYKRFYLLVHTSNLAYCSFKGLFVPWRSTILIR
jgi:hypothetical protein